MQDIFHLCDQACESDVRVQLCCSIHTRWPRCYNPEFYFSFSVFPTYLFCALGHSFPHSFPHAPFGPPPCHLTSHLTILQSFITCYCSAVCSSYCPPIMECQLTSFLLFSYYGLPAHDTLSTDCQFIMELYLDCQLIASS